MKMRLSTVKVCAAYVFCLLVGVMFLPASGRAQDQQSPAKWLDITIVHVKAGQQAQFEDLVKNLAAATTKTKSTPFMVYQVVRGTPGTFHIVTERQNLAELDNPPPPPMKPEEMANVMNRLLPTLDSGHAFIARNFPQDTTQGEGDAQAKLVMLRTVRVAFNREADFIKWVETDVMPIIKKAKLGLTFAEGAFGDSSQTFYFVTPVADWAAFDEQDPLVAAVGQKAWQQIMAKLNGIAQFGETTLLRTRPDLAPAAQ